MTPRHGNTFLDTSALNPRRAVDAAREKAEQFAEYAEVSAREALALAIWNSPATPTGRSKQR